MKLQLIANFYCSISRAPRQLPGDMEAIAFDASVKYQACVLWLGGVDLEVFRNKIFKEGVQNTMDNL